MGIALTFLGLLLAIAGEEAAKRAPDARPSPRPNFVVILADDLGYSDLGCYGGEIDTPCIDALAAEGVRFREFYNCSRCCPTRASLLSGRYPARVGMEEFGRTMDLSVPTVAEHLRSAGYRTAMTGKWHLSALPDAPTGERRIRWMNHQLRLDVPFAEPASLPTRRGFEKFYGMIWGVYNHFDPFSLCEGETPVTDVPRDYYVTDAIAAKSVDYVREFSQGEAPFFLYAAFSAPHWPLQAPSAAIEKYRDRYAAGWDQLRRKRFARQVRLGLFPAATSLGPVVHAGPAWDELPPQDRDFQAAKMAVHAAMVDRLDAAVGQIVDALRATGELDDTVVFFLSDNGASPEIPMEPGYDRYGATRDGAPALREAQLKLPHNRDRVGAQESYAGIGPAWASAANTPLRYWKMESYEGGCRTPLIVRQPGGAQSRGGFCEAVGHVIDVAPTLLDLAGVPDEPPLDFDGRSLRQALEIGAVGEARTLLFSHNDGRGVRQGKWKASKRGGQPWELFDLSVDPGETCDLAGANPDVLRRLQLEQDRRPVAIDKRIR